MHRRRGRDDGEGIVDLLFNVAERSPIAGGAVSIAGMVAGVALWFARGPYRGLTQIAGGICILGAICIAFVSLVTHLRQRSRRMAREQRLASATSAEALREMDWRGFEQLVADLFRRQGYHVREVGSAGGNGDGGVDLVLTRPGSDGGLEHLVQCKQYRTWSVGEPKVREFYGAMAAHRTRCEGILVICGRFTVPAREFARGKPLRLIEGEELVELVRNSNTVTPAVTTFIGARPPSSADPAPVCPTCGGAMKLRTARKGQHAGQPFWGCTGFPRCRGTRPA